jgi:hypothetical protein
LVNNLSETCLRGKRFFCGLLVVIFTIHQVLRQIEKRQPLVCWMGWTDARAQSYITFRNRLKQDPKATLPSAKDDEERARWIIDTGGSDATTAMIVG